jgi:hypothetical protein
MRCYPNGARNFRTTDRKILLTTIESFLHINFVHTFLARFIAAFCFRYSGQEKLRLDQVGRVCPPFLEPAA